MAQTKILRSRGLKATIEATDATPEEIVENNIEPNKEVLSERQKFHKWYNEVYLKGASDLVTSGWPHHADKHGILGYENNDYAEEVWSSDKNVYELVKVKGLCINCSQSQLSAKQEYDKTYSTSG